MTTPLRSSTGRVARAGLDVDADLAAFIETELLAGGDLAPEELWTGLQRIVVRFGDRNRRLLERRQALQAEIDDWHRTHPGFDPDDYREFLEDIGYLLPEPEPFRISTQGVAPEICSVAGPQLVVPVTNARYALNAANARWGSLYDAVYGTDVLGAPPPPGPYRPDRGAEVIAEVRRLLDSILPLRGATHAEVERYLLDGDRLAVRLADGRTVPGDDSVELVGWLGPVDGPEAIVCRHHGLGVEIVIDHDSPVGRTDRAGVHDIRLEAALTTIMDLEDSVAAVDGADKVAAYRNWYRLLAGTLEAEVDKDGATFTRRLAVDRAFSAPGGGTVVLPARSKLLIRNVGLLMTTPAVRLDGVEVPEGILDAVLTVLCAVAAPGDDPSVYVVKPKLHGPEEVRFTDELFTAVEDLLGLDPDTVKLGIMDEERRTTVNLRACVEAARHRVVFINTGFLDRTGDEIHTSMVAGPVVRKSDMRSQTWLDAYERNNVETGLACGFRGRAQIGKGMWPAPDLMADMLAEKIAHPEAGAGCAWVPSPTAATLHAVHYHRVDVAGRQAELEEKLAAGGPSATIGDLLRLPVASGPPWTETEIQAELDNNAQGILGYVVRWVDQGVGCSKVPNIDHVGLMEDRATCRISAQHIANWLLHGVVSQEQVLASLRRMAAIVDVQNSGDPHYRPMAPSYAGHAFAAACDLVLTGADQPSGYTEPVLHRHRRSVKQESSR